MCQLSVSYPLPISYRVHANYLTDGRGSGEMKKISVFLPALINASIKHKVVYKFDKNAVSPLFQIPLSLVTERLFKDDAEAQL
jgi:hypothetical protein